MAKPKQKLELTWIGKENRPKLEPRVLQEVPEFSYHASHRVSENDLFDNMLIRGDNLLALKALEQDYAGKVKCVYIDPPFNTKQAFEHYDDGLEHSVWLSLISERIQILHKLLHIAGTFFIHIDDNELGYLIAVADEIFGRENRQYIVTFKQGSATGHKAINPGCVNTSNFLLIYSRDKNCWSPNKLYTARERDPRYNQFIKNYEDDFTKWKVVPLSHAYAMIHDVDVKNAQKIVKEQPSKLDQFVLDFADRVVQLGKPDYKNISAEARLYVDKSTQVPDETLLLKREFHSDMYFKNGKRFLFYKDKLKVVDGELVTGEPLTTIWTDLLSNNIHKEGGVVFPKGKKPEALIKRCIDLSTSEGDLILDSFLGSGTTAAVAHKMGRRWIGVELGNHCETHCIPRLKSIIDGEDPGGITKAVDWQGGGGFRYYKLADSLIKEDSWGNAVINPNFKAELLAEAVCKVEGFRYAPSAEHYWMQGQATESDYIYVTTQSLSRAQLEVIAQEVGPERSLKICCGAFRVQKDAFENLTLKKIPQEVLDRCEWNHDDYSLRVENLPDKPKPKGQQELGLEGGANA